MNRVEWIEESKEKVGQLVSITTTKNKTYTPFKKVEIPFIFPIKRKDKIIAGLDIFSDFVNIALNNDIIERQGAWYKSPHKEAKLSGMKNVYDFYLENDEYFEDLKTLVLNLNNKND